MTRVTNIALEEHRSPKDPARRLTSQWYKDAQGTLLMRWVVESEPEERRLPAGFAA